MFPVSGPSAAERSGRYRGGDFCELLPPVFAIQQSGQFLRELIECGIRIFVIGVSHKIGSIHLHLGSGRKVVFVAQLLIFVKTDINPADLSVMAKQRYESLLNGVLQGGREAHVNSLHDNFGWI